MNALLWPDHENQQDFLDALQSEEAFVYHEQGHYIGFINLSLRHDYVEGTEHRPVGYVEGIFVMPQARGQGIAKKLMDFAASWAKEKGCSELASDAELTNLTSIDFHTSVGFTEANRIVCFVKSLL